MFVYIVKGVDSHDTVNLKVFANYDDASEWVDNYDGDEDFAFITIETREVV